MNPLTQQKNLQKLIRWEAERGVADSASWHAQFKHSAYIFAGGLSYDLTEGDVLAVFAQYGEVVDLNLPKNNEDPKKNRGFAFIAYEDQRSTVLAVDNFGGATVAGRRITVEHVDNYRKKRKEMTGEGTTDEESGGEGAASDPEPDRGDRSRQEGGLGGGRTMLPADHPIFLQGAAAAGLPPLGHKDRKHKKHKKEKKEKMEKKARKRHRSGSGSGSSSEDEADAARLPPNGGRGGPAGSRGHEAPGREVGVAPAAGARYGPQKPARGVEEQQQQQQQQKGAQVGPARPTNGHGGHREWGDERGSRGYHRRAAEGRHEYAGSQMGWEGGNGYGGSGSPGRRDRGGRGGRPHDETENWRRHDETQDWRRHERPGDERRRERGRDGSKWSYQTGGSGHDRDRYDRHDRDSHDSHGRDLDRRR